MKNILDYLKKYKDVSFKDFSFNEVDGLILCELTYLKYDNFIPSILEEKEAVSLNDYLENEENIDNLCIETIDKRKNKKLLKLIKDSKRFEGLKMNYFYNKFLSNELQQFCAMCFIFDDFIFVGYRGTDTTLIGWKEDFYMALMDAIPSQITAKNYLNKVAELETKPLFLGGHSKGGNLALFSAMHCDRKIIKRIGVIFNYDGPGFNKDIYDMPEYIEVEKLLVKLTCEQAMVGLLMYHTEEMFFVKAKGFSIFQHDPFNWKVCLDGSFKLVKNPVLMSRVLEKTVRDLLESTSIIERKRFIDLIFVILMDNPNSTIMDFRDKPLKSLRGVKARFKALSPKRKLFLKLMIKRYNKIWKQNFKYYLSIKYQFANKKVRDYIKSKKNLFK